MKGTMAPAAGTARERDLHITTNHEWRPVARKGEPTVADLLRLAGALLALALIMGLLIASLAVLLPLLPLLPLVAFAWRLRRRAKPAAGVTRTVAKRALGGRLIPVGSSG